MKIIVIATSNIDRAKKLKKLILSIYPKLKVLYLPSDLNKPLENGKSEFENSKIKADHYHNIIGSTVISMDVGVYFNEVKTSKQFGYKIHNKINALRAKEVDLYLFFRNYLDKNQIKSGNIKQVYYIVNNNISAYRELNIPFKICLKTSSESLSDNNPLNHFIIPNGFRVPFSKFSITDRLNYEKLYTRKIIEDLLEYYMNYDDKHEV